MAEILALVAAFFFALAATLQQKGALGMGEVSLGSPKSLLKLASQKWWLAGTLALLCGYGFQAVALANGRLAVIQPLLVTTIVFALPLGYFFTSQEINRREIGGAVVVVLGLAVFMVIGDAADGNDNAPANEWALAVLVFGSIAAVLLVMGNRGSLVRKAGLYGACAGVLYGLSASLCKPTVEILGDDGFGAVLTSWEAYAFAIAGILAFVVQQVSLATGKLAASVATRLGLQPARQHPHRDPSARRATRRADMAQGGRVLRPRGRAVRRGRHLAGDRGGQGAGRRSRPRARDLNRVTRRPQLVRDRQTRAAGESRRRGSRARRTP